jgi:hypothetical protein
MDAGYMALVMLVQSTGMDFVMMIFHRVIFTLYFGIHFFGTVLIFGNN